MLLWRVNNPQPQISYCCCVLRVNLFKKIHKGVSPTCVYACICVCIIRGIHLSHLDTANNDALYPDGQRMYIYIYTCMYACICVCIIRGIHFSHLGTANNDALYPDGQRMKGIHLSHLGTANNDALYPDGQRMRGIHLSHLGTANNDALYPDGQRMYIYIYIYMCICMYMCMHKQGNTLFSLRHRPKTMPSTRSRILFVLSFSFQHTHCSQCECDRCSADLII